MKDFVLKLDNISKSFGDIQVLSSVSLEAHAGEILAVVGENGAGKSTLMKILCGVWPHGSYQGSIFLNKSEQKFLSPKDAESSGIAIIHQELNLIPELSIAENIFLSREPNTWGVIDQQKLLEKTTSWLRKFNLDLAPEAKIKELSIGQKQLVEIIKALTLNAKILILDEPTSALARHEISFLFKILRQLKSEGVLCLYISHKLEEIFELCDRIFVLRDGKSVTHFATHAISSSEVISAMVGRALDNCFFSKAKKQSSNYKTLEICSLTSRNKSGKLILNNVSLSLHEGEVLGIAGLMGSGRSEFILTLFGATDFKIEGKIILNGKNIRILDPRDAIQNGFGLLTEDRKLSGIIPFRSVQENMTLPSLKKLSNQKVVDFLQESNMVDRFVQSLKIKAANTDSAIKTLSGGNQQKVLLARWLMTQPKVLLLDEPTRGVDVGAKADIYDLIFKLSAQGVAILLVSSELPEILNLSHRIAVFNRGHLVQILDRDQATQEMIMTFATQPLEIAA